MRLIKVEAYLHVVSSGHDGTSRQCISETRSCLCLWTEKQSETITHATWQTSKERWLWQQVWWLYFESAWYSWTQRQAVSAVWCSYIQWLFHWWIKYKVSCYWFTGKWYIWTSRQMWTRANQGTGLGQGDQEPQKFSEPELFGGGYTELGKSEKLRSLRTYIFLFVLISYIADYPRGIALNASWSFIILSITRIIFASPMNSCHIAFTTSSSKTNFEDCQCQWYAALQFNCLKHLFFSRRLWWSIAIWNPRIYYSKGKKG